MTEDQHRECGELSMELENRRRRQREWQREWRRNNPELSKARKRAYYAKHREAVLAKMQARRDANREAVRAWHRQDYARNPERKRADNLRRKFGLSPTQYDEMLAAQDGTCAICKELPPGRRLAVDHNHASGAVRGLLCDRCNFALAMVEREGWTESALAYLAHHRE